jgi:DNA-binding protein HU-beta
VTKKDFIDAVAAKSNLSKKDAAAAVDAVLESVKEALARGDDVIFTGFGKFTVQNRKARTGINPRNPGQKVTIPASRVPKFSASSQLKAAVGGSRGYLDRCIHGIPTRSGKCEHDL